MSKLGPWSYSMDGESHYARIYFHDLGRMDKVKGGDSLHGYCGESSARLIAAAPEMLDMLKECRDTLASVFVYGVPDGMVDRVNAIIQKAEGNDATT